MRADSHPFLEIIEMNDITLVSIVHRTDPSVHAARGMASIEEVSVCSATQRRGKTGGQKRSWCGSQRRGRYRESCCIEVQCRNTRDGQFPPKERTMGGGPRGIPNKQGNHEDNHRSRPFRNRQPPTCRWSLLRWHDFPTKEHR